MSSRVEIGDLSFLFMVCGGAECGGNFFGRESWQDEYSSRRNAEQSVARIFAAIPAVDIARKAKNIDGRYIIQLS